MLGSDPSGNSPIVSSPFLIFYGNEFTLLNNVSQPETMRTFLVALTLSDCNYLKTIVQHAITLSELFGDYCTPTELS
jgi:hypothetical protein